MLTNRPDNLPTSPLSAAIRRAAQLPKSTGATDAHANAARRVILADVSGSMREPAAGTRTKHDLLTEVLAALWPEITRGSSSATLCAFASGVTECSSPATLNAPDGGTSLAAAITHAASTNPRVTVLLTDGRPDDEQGAFRAADKLPGRLDVVYIGPESDVVAQRFLAELARRRGGTYTTVDLVKLGHSAGRQLTGALTRTLMLSAGGAR